MAELAIDSVDGELLPPTVSPFRLIVSLDGKDQLPYHLWQRSKPLVVFVGVIGGWGQQFDDRPERAPGAKDGPSRAVFRLGLFADTREVAGQDLRNLLHVGVIIPDKYRTLQQNAGYGC